MASAAGSEVVEQGGMGKGELMAEERLEAGMEGVRKAEAPEEVAYTMRNHPPSRNERACGTPHGEQS